MGQVLHGSARTTEAVRRAIQHSQESLRALARRYGINQKTVRKWKGRRSVADLRTGPKEARSTTLSVEDEAVVVAFRRHTSCAGRLPLCPAGHPSHLTRSSLHRCLQRHGSAGCRGGGRQADRRKFKAYPIGYFTSTSPRCVPRKAGSTCSSRSIARQVRLVELHEKATRRVAATSFGTSSWPCPTRSTRVTETAPTSRHPAKG